MVIQIMKSWYEKGLQFQCTGCGQCCTGAPGYVWVTPEEMEAIAKRLSLPLDQFIKKYVRRVQGRYSLKEDSKNFDCVFLKGKKCEIYDERPKQCRTFPWWPEHLKSRKDWEEVSLRCEGVNHPEAPIVAFGEIQRQVEVQTAEES